MGTTHFEDRIASAKGIGGHAAVQFESHQAVGQGGVLFLLPALLSQGLLKTKEIYEFPQNHYYGLESVVLTLAFMALARIKNPEQLKQCKPGEIGRLIGLDRTPEVKCLRGKIKLLASQGQAQELNRRLIDEWYKNNPAGNGAFLYIDGHQRIYYGNKANLPSKYISRQKLCLAATTEYWVHDGTGQPVLKVMGELTEKLEQAIEEQIIPELQKTVLLPDACSYEAVDPKVTSPVCTLIFDREGYHPSFFQKLWDRYRIAVITYRKNTQDKWPNDDFKQMEVNVLDQLVNMNICEKEIRLDGTLFREIRRNNEGGHQTAIISNNYFIDTPIVAGRMFGRWIQENFFKYLIADFDFDKMITYGTESVHGDKEVVNPQWRKADYQLKKQKEKTARLKAKLYPIAEQVMEQPIVKISSLSQKQIKLKEKIDASIQLEQTLKEQRSNYPSRIKVENMGEKQRYNQLKHESKILMNIIKMVCYRAETAVANLLSAHLSKYWNSEKRMLVKQIIQSNADLIVDEQNKTLTVVLHSLSAHRFNIAVGNLATLLNQTETVFPGSDLKIIFKTSDF